MSQEQARAMLLGFCRELLDEHSGKTSLTFEQMADMMFKRFAPAELVSFISAWSDAPCACGLALCPAGLTFAVKRCYYGNPPTKQNAPTSRKLH